MFYMVFIHGDMECGDFAQRSPKQNLFGILCKYLLSKVTIQTIDEFTAYQGGKRKLW